MTIYFRGISFVFICLFLNSCTHYCKEGTGDLKVETRTLPSFTKIKLLLSADVIVVHGNAFSVIIKTQPNLLENILTTVNENELDIASKDCINAEYQIGLTIYVPEVEKLEINGSGTITVPDTFSVKNLKLVIQGSGDINGKFQADSIESQINGSGYMNLSGNAINNHISITGSGNIRSQDLLCKNTNIEISGSSYTFVNASQMLNVKVKGSSTVHYKGKPFVVCAIDGSGKLVAQD